LTTNNNNLLARNIRYGCEQMQLGGSMKERNRGRGRMTDARLTDRQKERRKRQTD